LNDSIEQLPRRVRSLLFSLLDFSVLFRDAAFVRLLSEFLRLEGLALFQFQPFFINLVLEVFERLGGFLRVGFYLFGLGDLDGVIPLFQCLGECLRGRADLIPKSGKIRPPL